VCCCANKCKEYYSSETINKYVPSELISKIPPSEITIKKTIAFPDRIMDGEAKIDLKYLYYIVLFYIIIII
jgi:hypothetical protein